ncbi:MAG: sulfotransferase family 2 domain-containing protein [Pseudomonadota bacterium]
MDTERERTFRRPLGANGNIKAISRLLVRHYRSRIRRGTVAKQRAKALRQTNVNGYSLKECLKTKSIFVHVPKTAGVSVNKALYGSLGAGHKTLNDYVLLLSPSDFLTFFKFTIVRNPWSRVVSAYNFLREGGFNAVDREFWEQELKQYQTFESFVKHWLTPVNVRRSVHFKPQCDFVFDYSAHITVDFVCYYENLEQDFAYLCSQIPAHREPGHCKLGYNNVGPGGGAARYTDEYTDETKLMVGEIYAQDVYTFGYEFAQQSTNDLSHYRLRDPRIFINRYRDFRAREINSTQQRSI